MILKENIQSLVGNHVAPYIYNAKNFEPGKTPIYYSGPYWDNKETEAAVEAFLNGKWVTAGEKVYKFENRFSKRFNTKHSHMVNSGSSANLILIAALKKRFGWNDDDEIIVSPVGFATTVSVLYQNRLKPVFADIEWDTLNFDLDQVESKITSKTKGIFISPVLGNPPDMDRLMEIATKHDILLIGDNCDSLGSKWNGKYLNEYYIAYSNSFYPAHHISTGEGGMVCTNDDELKKLFVKFSWWGRDCYCIGSANLLSCGTCGNRFDKWLENYEGNIDHKYVFAEMGYNVKPLDLQGAIGLEQLDKLDEIEANRKTSKETLSKIFTNNNKKVRLI
jgi:CDP-6-deoxy-D-xylo-4-hexulose-3-dehydrase